MLTDESNGLPRRLKQLRLELGWNLDDVARAIQAASKGVVSNWETTSERRRIPPLGTLLALARWYGVSLDYLVGVRGAERDSAAVRQAKSVLKERFPTAIRTLEDATPTGRFRAAVGILQGAAPGAFFPARVAASLLLSESDLSELLSTRTVPDAVLERFARFADLPVSWFFLRPEDVSQ